MRQLLILLSCFILIIKSNIVQAQTITIPIKWKVGQLFKYTLKHEGTGGMMLGDFSSTKAFQIKVLKQNFNTDSSYLVEWRYLSFVTFMTDTIKDEIAVTQKKFILETPFLIQLDKRGRWRNFADTTLLKQRLIDRYKTAKKTALEPGGFEFKISQINESENFEEYLDATLPEIRIFFSAYDLLPASVSVKKDTVETFNDYILDYTKTVTIPKVLVLTSSHTNSNLLKVTNSERLNEAALKKYFSENTRAGWDKMELKKDDPIRITNEKMLDDFQPKLSNTYEATFDKKNSTLTKFKYAREEWMMLRGGSSWYYSFKQL